MTECKHLNSSVTNTSVKGKTTSNGHCRIGHADYDYLVMRRRQCLDCGVRFTTIEVDRGYFESVMDWIPRARENVMAEIASFLAQNLLGKKE